MKFQVSSLVYFEPENIINKYFFFFFLKHTEGEIVCVLGVQEKKI